MSVIIAGQRIKKLQFGRRNDDPVLVHLRQALKEARAVRRRFSATPASGLSPLSF